MNDQPDHLPYKVEQWDDTGTQVTSILAAPAITPLRRVHS